MIKLIAFDLDGVLVDSVDLHTQAFNESIKEVVGIDFIPTEDEHFNGLKTTDKLKFLSKHKNLPLEYCDEIWKNKQSKTFDLISKIEKNVIHCNMLNDLKEMGYKLSCCSNSIKQSVLFMLSNLGILPYFDLILSNEDVKNAKPHPEMYWNSMSFFGVLPEETLILEDSYNGLISAKKSGANIIKIESLNDVTFEKIIQTIQKIDEKNNSSQSM